MSLQKGHFEYVGRGITWISDKEPEIETRPTKQELNKILQQQVKYYKNLVETLKSELQYYKNKFNINGQTIQVSY